ncbi:sodium-coupled monocarboxylate transporter 1-like [Montipora capricornis]|uniref:sodium-coupled monocarboxylate transporter 1-like n=1 Tax=Montipora capricornis TaxID=246305 RepID=UPI0035F19CB8
MASIEMDKKVQFGVIDFVVFGVMLLLSAVIGIYHAFTGGKQRTTKEFLFANRGMMGIPVALSLIASFMSAITILGVPSEIYSFGTQYWLIVASYVILFPSVALIFVPVFRAVDISSSYEYLEKRFSFGIRILGSICFIIQTSLYMAIVVYGPAIALEAVTGFPVWASIVSIGIVCTFYTTIGGIKAVIWNDVFQAVVMLGGLVAILIVGVHKVGGFGNVWDRLDKGKRLNFIDLNPDPTQRLSIWSLVIGGAFGLFPLWAVNQTAVQRFLAAKSNKEAKLAVWINLPLSIFAVSLCALCGCVIYAFYADCDPISSNLIKKGDQILPYFVMHVLGSFYVIPGLFMACLFSGTLSTVSSGLNSLAAVVLEDFMKPLWAYRRKELTEIEATLYSKLLALGFGVVTVALSFLATQMGAILQTFYSVFGVVGGPVVGVFCLGMFTRRANSRGAWIGLAMGFAIGLWIGIGAKVYPPPVSKAPVSTMGCTAATSTNTTISVLMAGNTTSTPPIPTAEYEGLVIYRLSWLWYSFVCFVVTYLTGYIVSVVWPGEHESYEVDSRLLFKIEYCLPECGSKRSREHCLPVDQDEAETREAKNGDFMKAENYRGNTQGKPNDPLLMTTSF